MVIWGWLMIVLPTFYHHFGYYPIKIGDMFPLKRHEIPIVDGFTMFYPHYPLVNYHNYGKSPCFMGKSTINGHFQ